MFVKACQTVVVSRQITPVNALIARGEPSPLALAEEGDPPNLRGAFLCEVETRTGSTLRNGCGDASVMVAIDAVLRSWAGTKKVAAGN
jgi:hypothetical protein